MFARIVQITAKSGQGPHLSQHVRDRTINVLKQQRAERGKSFVMNHPPNAVE